MTHTDPRVARTVRFFEEMTRDDLARLAEIYAVDARFKDPFNEVQGVAAIERVFAHMYDTLDAPRFVIRDAVAEGDNAFLSWDFCFRMRRFDRATDQRVRGATHLVFAPDGRIALHRDYWDAAEELYEKLPVVGALMRWLKRRASG
ncbi:MAG TPA: nuclear transport factor 2 family protein [Burkholderiaceae bacterium]|nr:nuclear transport factor 2 family protein [Burkholderiaceae bacterium]